MPTLSEIIQNAGFTLSELHRQSSVSRTTLSRITNGKQALSRKTARKLAPILGVSADGLIQPVLTRPAAPEILRISALQIRRWGETQQARAELPELVSRLIRTELPATGSIHAPSDERISERGPDIEVSAPRSTRRIPGGQSVWEVSTAENLREKATKDLSRRRVPAGWRCDETSWVFVTTGTWPGKDEWIFKQQAERPWRSIRVLDATDLKSWIDESLGVQVWLMGRMGQESRGFQWLREAVEEWCSAASPPLDTTLLESSVDKYSTAWCDWVRSGSQEPLSIIGESRGEALLLLQALIDRGDPHPSWIPIEGLCVDTKEGLRQLLGSPPSDMVMIPVNESVRELAVAHCGRIRVVLPDTGQPRVSDSLKVLPAGRTAVRNFLVGKGVDSGLATQLARSSGGAVSVLRRLMSKDGGQEHSLQVSDRQSRILTAAGLFGIWDAASNADRKVVLRLTGQQDYEDIEEAWTELLNLPEAPVWMDGERRGVNSRLDTWQRFTVGKITPQSIDRFFDAVSTALKQVPLQRPGQRLSAPEEYQMLRDSQVSAELLRGLAQGLVLLAEFGECIDSRLLGPRVAVRVEKTVFAVLGDITVERLRALSQVLPQLAESAPEAFLAAMEADLGQTNSAQKALLNFRWAPSESEAPLQLLHDTDAVNYRSPLMWAYETLAWFPEHVENAIDLLGRLADEPVLDHHGGQPRQSLAKLLKPWNHGSVLDSERHCAVLRKLARDHSEWAFDLIRKCLPLSYDTADQAHLPLWRGCLDGADSKQPEEHRMAVYRTATDILTRCAATSARTIHVAIDVIEHLSEAEAARVWQSIAAWAVSESCSNEERTRLVRRLTAFADGATIKNGREDNRKWSRHILTELSAFQVTAPDIWLFEDDARIRERRPDDATLQITEGRLEQKRRAALQRLWESGGAEAILSLVPEVRDTHLIGVVASHVLPRDGINEVVLQALWADDGADQSPMRWFIQGLLEGMDDLDGEILENVIRSSTFAEQNPNWLPCLLARFPLGVGTARTDGLSREELNIYWQQFESGRNVIPSDRKDWLIAGLCSVKRPQTALRALRGEFKGARTESLRLLIDTLPQSREQNPGNTGFFVETLVVAVLGRPDLSSAEAARIEFMFFDILKRDEMPELAKAVATDPTWFKEALMLCSRRRDHVEDPPDWKQRKENAPKWLQERAYRLFEWLPRLPGTTSNRYDVDIGFAWTEEILSFADEHDRREFAETLLGQAFGSAGFHKDGSPTDELTLLLERVQSSRIEQGVAMAVSNQFGAVWLPADDAGRPYRDQAEFYLGLEKRFRDSAPCMARIMRLLQRGFRNQGRWADDERRLDSHLDDQA